MRYAHRRVSAGSGSRRQRDVDARPVPVSPRTVFDEVLDANAAYSAAFGERADLARRPARRLGILTCMDARLDPTLFAGLREGDANVVRNAGGRASDDALRSIVIACAVNLVSEWLVIQHTDCGLSTITPTVMRDLLLDALGPAAPGPEPGIDVDWLLIDEPRQAIVDDVRRIRTHPLVPGHVTIRGYLYDVRTGRLEEIEEATAIGRPV